MCSGIGSVLSGEEVVGTDKAAATITESFAQTCRKEAEPDIGRE